MALFDDLKVKAVELTQVGMAKSERPGGNRPADLASTARRRDNIRKAYINWKLYSQNEQPRRAAYTCL